jgi:GAF domain-containing protein
VGFCSHAILQASPLVIPDATQDPRFADNPFVVGDFGLRFYAGVAIHGPSGQPVGAVAIVDTAIRELRPDQVELLRKFASAVEAQLQP